MRAELANGRINSVAQSPEIKLVKDELVHQTAGMPTLAEALLNNTLKVNRTTLCWPNTRTLGKKIAEHLLA